MFHGTEGYLAAQSELISLHIDMSTRRVSPMDPAIYERLEAVRAAHAVLPPPSNLGRVIEVRSRAAAPA